MLKILISKDDYKKLEDLINEYEKRTSLPIKTRGYISFLKEKLNKAQIIEAGDIKLIDLVTMNSSVRFKNLSIGEEKEYLFVHPKLEWKNLGRLAILSDLGVALLGHKKWEVVKMKKADGLNYEVRILDVQSTSQEWIEGLEEQC